MSLDHATSAVRSRHPWIRNLLPIYSRRQLVWNVAIVIGLILTLWRFDPAFAPFGTLSGCGGAAVVQYATRPAFMLIDPSRTSLLQDMLRRSAWREEPEAAGWVAPLPAWLRWDDAVVTFRPVANRVRVSGPAHVLGRLRKSLG